MRTNWQLQDVKDALGFLREAKAMLSLKGEVNREVALGRVEQAMRKLEQVSGQVPGVVGALVCLEKVKVKLSEGDKGAALEKVEQAMRLLEQVAEGQEAVAEANAKAKKRITGYSRKR